VDAGDGGAEVLGDLLAVAGGKRLGDAALEPPATGTEPSVRQIPDGRGWADGTMESETAAPTREELALRRA